MTSNCPIKLIPYKDAMTDPRPDAATTTPDAAAVILEFVAYSLAQAHPSVRAWRGTDLKADLLRETARYAALLTDEVAARESAARMPSVKVAAPSFKPRLITVHGLRCLAHIEFTSTNGDCPFIRLEAASRAPGSIADPALFAGLAGAFEAFKPRACMFHHPAHLPLLALGSKIDQHILAAPAQVMATREPVTGLRRVALGRATDLDVYPRYVEAYEQVYRERPQLRDVVHIESTSSLAECLGHGLLLDILVDGGWAGIVAARREMVAGLSGIYMVDIVMLPAIRGQGLGPAVHQRLAELVAVDDPAAVIHGTISPLNTPSLKTALRAGRIEIGAFHWLEL